MSGSSALPIRTADQLTQSAVRDALAAVVADLCVNVATDQEFPEGLDFPALRLQGAIIGAHSGMLPWRRWPAGGQYQWQNSERRSFAEMVRHLGSQNGENLAYQVMIFVGLAFVENEVRAMSPEVFRSELLQWAPGRLYVLPPRWFLHPAIAAVVRDPFLFPFVGKYRLFRLWYDAQDQLRRLWAHPPPGTPPIKREPFVTGPMLPPRALRPPPTVAAPAPAPAPASPRLKSEEVEVKVKEEEEDW